MRAQRPQFPDPIQANEGARMASGPDLAHLILAATGVACRFERNPARTSLYVNLDAGLRAAAAKHGGALSFAQAQEIFADCGLTPASVIDVLHALKPGESA